MGYLRTRSVINVEKSTKVNLGNKIVTSFLSNDYLGMSKNRIIITELKKSANTHGIGSGSSPLISGYSESHHYLEKEIAEYLNAESCLVVNSGYMANLCLLNIFDQEINVIQDRQSHNSIIESSKINKIKINRYKHLDNSHLEYLPQETIVFANGLYSQEFNIKISDNSSFLFTDLIRLGRSSAGESIESGVFRSKLEIMRNGNLCDDWEFVDQIELTKFSFEAKSGMDYKPVFGSLIWICEKEFPKTKISYLKDKIKIIFKENNNYLSLGTLENGISIRFLGTSSQDARKCFFSIWTQIRTVCGFCKPEYQGVWPLQDL